MTQNTFFVYKQKVRQDFIKPQKGQTHPLRSIHIFKFIILSESHGISQNIFFNAFNLYFDIYRITLDTHVFVCYIYFDGYEIIFNNGGWMVMKQKREIAEAFKNYYTEQKNILEENAKHFKNSGDEWEYVRVKIKTGILDMATASLRTMFDLSENPANIPSHHWLRKELDITLLEDENERFTSYFAAFLDHVTKPWQASLENAQSHNDVEIVEKETIKIAYVQELQQHFNNLFSN